ncbi:MAG: DHA2 family efflux MFS transporter permease subunit [Candidatus Promineofilum sp.]|nr:DHA2 family efflux MFS transporter permease subunit [Promineifilum sp.]
MFSRQINQKIAVSVVYVAALFMTIMDATIVNVALPTLGNEFQVETAAVNGVVIFYLVALAATIPVSGWLGDKLGGRRVLLGAILLFVIASALCGMSQSLGQLEAFRVLQGIAGGLMTPVGLAMLWRTFPPAERARASAILVFPTALAPAVGPVLGGFFVTFVSWRWVFFVNVPIGLAAFLFGLVYLAVQQHSDPGEFDFAGFILAGAGLGLTMYGISQGPFAGWSQPGIMASCLIGVTLLVALVVIELRRTAPLLKLRLLEERLFGLSNAVMLLGGIAFIGTLYIVSLFYQDGLGLTAAQAGLSILPEALGVMAGSQIVAKMLYPVFGPRRILFGALLLNAVMMMALTTVGPATSLWWPRAFLFILGAGMSGVFIPVQTAAFAATSHRDMGGATTLLSTQQQLAGALGVAIMTTVFVAAGPVVMPGGEANLTPYRVAFATAAVFALLGAVVALLIRDADAAATITRWRERPQEPKKAGEPVVSE